MLLSVVELCVMFATQRMCECQGAAHTAGDHYSVPKMQNSYECVSLLTLKNDL